MNHIYKVVWSKVRGCYIVVSEIAKNNGKSRAQKAAVLGAVFMGTVLAANVGGWNTAEAAGSQVDNITVGKTNGLSVTIANGIINSYNSSGQRRAALGVDNQGNGTLYLINSDLSQAHLYTQSSTETGNDGITRLFYTSSTETQGGEMTGVHTIAVLEDGLKYQADNYTDSTKTSKVTVKHQLNSTMDVTGGADTDNLSDNNIGVIATSAVEDADGNVTQNGKLEIKLAKDLTGLNSVTTGNTKINTDGLTVKNTDGSSIIVGNNAVSTTDRSGTKTTKSGIGVNGTDGTTNGVSMWAEGSGTSTKGHIGLNGSDGAFTDIWTDYGTKTLNSEKNTTVSKTEKASRLVYTDAKGNNHEVATMDDGQIYAGDVQAAKASANAFNRTMNQQTNIVGGVTNLSDLSTANNVGVVSDGTDTLTIRLAKKLSGLTSVTTQAEDGSSKTVQDGSGITITPATLSDGKTAVSLTGSGLNNGGNTITNVAAGSADTDAVNVSQLKEVAKTASQHTAVTVNDGTFAPDTAGTYSSGGNLQIKEKVNADGQATYDIKLSKDIDLGTNGSIAAGSTTINSEGVTTNKAVIGGNTTIDSTGVNTNKVTVGTNTTLNDGSATIGKVKINGENDGDSQHTSTISGLSNTTFDTSNAAQYATSTRAATEAQLKTVYDAAAKSASTVTVNGGNSAGNLSMTTNTNDNGSTNYDISLSNNVTIGSTGTNGQNGTLTVTSADGTKSVTTDGEKGQLTFTDGSNTASLKAAAASAGLDGTTSLNRVAVDNHTVATLDDGMKFAGDTGTALKQTINSTTNIKGGVSDTSKLADNNIGVVSDGNNTLTVKLAKDLQGLSSVNTTTLNATTVNSTDVNATNVKATTVTADTVNGSTFNAGNTTVNSSGLTVKSSDGSRSLTVQDGNVSMAGNQVHNVAAGTADDDAVNVSQLKKMGGEISNVSRRVDRVGAGAAALAALHPQDFDPDDKWDFAVGYGNYRGANAAAVGAFYQPNEDTTLSIGGTVGGGENMINAGISFKFGQGNHVSNSRVAMAKEILALKDYVEKQDAEIQQLKALVGSQSGKTEKRSLLFPDVPENHWAYDYVKKLADRGLLEGYPDGEFKGNRTLTRYEFAAIFERALENGAAADTDLQHMADEFNPEIRELSLNRFRVDRVSGKDNDHNKVERVRVNSRDEIVQQKNGEKSTVYRDSYGGQIEKSAEAAK